MILRLSSPARRWLLTVLVLLLVAPAVVTAKGKQQAKPKTTTSTKSSKNVKEPAAVSLRGSTEKTVPLRTHSLYARRSPPSSLPFPFLARGANKDTWVGGWM